MLPAAASKWWRNDTARLHDLHWSPDGERLGLVRTDAWADASRRRRASVDDGPEVKPAHLGPAPKASLPR